MWLHVCFLLINVFFFNNINIKNINLNFLIKKEFLFFYIIFLIFYLYNLLYQKNLIYFLSYIWNFKSIVKCNNILNIPLLNNIFLYHYLFLVIGWIYNYFILKKFYKNNNYFNYLIILMSIFIGGFWALQEFNWGGWWNWDILEIFSFLTVLFLILNFHVKKHYFLKTYFFKNKINIIFFFLIYTYFNKIGFSSSIHSFVKSVFFKINWIFYIILVFFFFSFFKNLNFFKIKISIIFLFFLFFSNFFIFKEIIIYTFIYLFVFISIFKKINKLNHTIIYYIIFYIILINYFNKSFTNNFFSYQFSTLMFANKYALNINHHFNLFNFIFLKNKFISFKIKNIWYDYIWVFFYKLNSLQNTIAFLFLK